jgi:3-hydroxybutyryl-CoA dehydrogenase
MASGIAIGFVQKGCQVRILGRSLDSANHCRSRVNSVVPTGLPIIVDTINQLNDWTSTDWIIETVAEDLSIKKDIFTWLDQKVPGHIPIGSNSSGFSISKISQGLSTSYRMMNAHYFMPAEIVPLVEIVIGQDTNIEIAKKVCEMYINLGSLMQHKYAHSLNPILKKRNPLWLKGQRMA